MMAAVAFPLLFILLSEAPLSSWSLSPANWGYSSTKLRITESDWASALLWNISEVRDSRSSLVVGEVLMKQIEPF